MFGMSCNFTAASACLVWMLLASPLEPGHIHLLAGAPWGAQLGSHRDVNPAIYGPWAGLRGPISVIPSPKIADCLESRGKIRGWNHRFNKHFRTIDWGNWGCLLWTEGWDLWHHWVPWTPRILAFASISSRSPLLEAPMNICGSGVWPIRHSHTDYVVISDRIISYPQFFSHSSSVFFVGSLSLIELVHGKISIHPPL